MANAAGIATINALAPGRTYTILGTGNTAMRMLGHKPMGARALREAVLKGQDERLARYTRQDLAGTLRAHLAPLLSA